MARYDPARSRRKYGSPRLVNRHRVARDAMKKFVLAGSREPDCAFENNALRRKVDGTRTRSRDPHAQIGDMANW